MHVRLVPGCHTSEAHDINNIMAVHAHHHLITVVKQERLLLGEYDHNPACSPRACQCRVLANWHLQCMPARGAMWTVELVHTVHVVHPSCLALA